MKKILILENNNGRLANQLWHFANVYAYCLEKGYDCENYAFFRYWHYFNFTITNSLIRLFFGDFYCRHKNIKFAKLTYLVFATLLKIIHHRYVARDEDREFLLPPAQNNDLKQRNVLQAIEKNNHTWYFCGWLFRNPIGLNKYYNEIKKYFKPNEKFYSEIIKLKTDLRKKYKLIVGVHIRQGDYKTWQGGQYFFSCPDVANILKDYLNYQKEFKLEDVVFVICSDGSIDKKDFNGFNVVSGPGSEIADLYMLAETDLIIGSNSTYGTWASYYGQVPFVKFSRDKIDWSVLNGK